MHLMSAITGASAELTIGTPDGRYPNRPPAIPTDRRGALRPFYIPDHHRMVKSDRRNGGRPLIGAAVTGSIAEV